MTDHSVSFTLEWWGVYGDVKCDAPETADCRYTCSSKCESWGDIYREDGIVFHVYEDDNGTSVRHPMTPCDCIVIPWLSDDSIMERYSGPTVTVHDGPIVVEWNGDGYSWHYPEDQS